MMTPDWPPQQVTSPPPPPPRPQPTSARWPVVPARTLSSGLSGTLQGFMWAIGGLAALSSVLALVTIGQFQAYWDTPYGSFAEAEALDDWIAAEDTLSGALTLMGLGIITAFVLLVIWTNQAHKATQHLWTGQRKWTSGWAVGGWFIPVGNLIIPRAVISEIEKLATSPRTDGRVDERWHRRPTAAIGWVWWIAFAAGWILHLIGGRVGAGADSSSDAIIAGYALSALGLATLAVGAACGALYLRRIGKALGPDTVRPAQVPAPPAAAATSGHDTVRYSTAPWSTAQLSNITRGLATRGVRYELADGDLVVNRSAIDVTDTVVEESTTPVGRWTT